MTRDKTKICILGGGFGGLYTALYLSKFSWSHKCNITLVEQKDRFVFTPLLYELLTAELQPREIAPSYHKLLRSKNIKFCQDRMTGVDLKNQAVNLESGDRQGYDYLIIAVGNKGRVPKKIPGAEYAINFRTLADVESIEAKLELLKRSGRVKFQVAVVGAGASGVELACKLADRLPKQAQIRLIDRSSKILKDFSTPLRSAAYRALNQRKIKIDLESKVKKITPESICLFSSENEAFTLPADLVLWTAGVESHESILNLEYCQLDFYGKILTLPTLQLIDYPEVFALGDAAKIYDNSQFVPTTAQVAYQQASLIAKNIQASLKGKQLLPFRYNHLGDMLTLGNGAAAIYTFSLLLEGYLAAIIRKLVYIQRLPTSRHRLQVLRNILIRRITKILSLRGKQNLTI